MKGVFFFLGELNDQDIEWMTKQGKRQHLTPGDELVREGRPLEKMFLVLEGEFSVTVASRGTVPVGSVRVGEVVGEISFIDSRPPSGTVTASTDSVVLSIPRPALAARLREDLGFAARFYRALSMMLAYRLRAQTLRKSENSDSDGESSDQLDMNILDTLHLAGARFQRILSQMASK